MRHFRRTVKSHLLHLHVAETINSSAECLLRSHLYATQLLHLLESMSIYEIHGTHEITELFTGCDNKRKPAGSGVRNGLDRSQPALPRVCMSCLHLPPNALH